MEEFAVQLHSAAEGVSLTGWPDIAPSRGLHMVFYMRAIGHACTHRYLRQYDKEVDAALAALFGDEDGGLPEEARGDRLHCHVG